MFEHVSDGLMYIYPKIGCIRRMGVHVFKGRMYHPGGWVYMYPMIECTYIQRFNV